MNNCEPNCGCKFEVDSSCVRYTSVDLGTTSINTGDTIQTTIIKIDAAINNLNQQFDSSQTSDIEGPINKMVKFGPPNTPIVASQTEDNGTSVGVNTPPDSAFKMSVDTSPNQSGLKVNSLNNGKEAIVAKNESTGAIINKGIVSLVSGSSVSNIGIESSATGASNINVGISATALGATANYSAQLKDGSETTQGGKFLKDTGSGKANWNYIYLADIQDYQAYSLPISTSETLGGVIIGSGINVTSGGVISVTPYSLPISTSETLGGVIIGSGINVTSGGVISVPTPTAYSLPTASSTVLGGVKIGSGITITSGTISVTPYSLPISTSTILGGVKIGSGINVTVDGTISVTPATAYSLPTASSTVLGGIKVGNGLAISGQGILSANIGQGTLNYVAKFTPDGYSIDDSIIQDNGTNVSINSAPLSTIQLYISSTLSSGTNVTLSGSNALNIGSGSYATGAGGTNIGYNTQAHGATIANVGGRFRTGLSGDAILPSGYDIAVYGSAEGSSRGNIGGAFTATGGTSNYGVQIKDGTQTSGGGKFLRDMGDGKANWADINPQKTISASYTLTAADNGYSILVLNAATAITITIPSGLPTSMQVGFIQDGTGDVTFAGSTFNCSVIGATKIKGQYDQAYLEKKGTNEVYYLLGNVKV